MLQSSSSTRGSSKSKKSQQEDKRIRRLYQSLLQRRPVNYWNILDFPYLAEVVRYDSNYLRRILTNIFIDHPALSQYLILIAWRELRRKTKHSQSQTEQQKASRYEMLPIGFERTVWLMYKRQIELSSIWSPTVVLEISKVAKELLPTLTFNQFVSKINGLRDCSFKR